MLFWERSFETVETSFEMLRAGVKLAAAHGFQHWDAIIVSASAAAECDILLSEDMHHGFVWRGMTIVNPFADPPHPLLASLLDG